MAVCDKCGKRAIILVRYSGAHLCSNHFSDFVERRVKHEIRRQLHINGGERIAVAVSGGKDSMVALHLLANIIGKRKDISLSAVTVDEGIAGYRESSIPIVARVCRDIRIEHLKMSLREIFGVTVDQIASLDRPLSTCSYCGVMRRSAMNRTARDWRATHLATGLNLDDTAQSIMMSFARGDVERLARLGPHSKVQEGLVPRLQPLRSIPESETTLYAIVNDIPFHDLECPYADEALRNQYRDAMFRLEGHSPGTRHSIVRSYDEIRPLLVARYPPSRLRTCPCGEPALGDRCKACELVDSLRSSSRT